MLMPVPEMFDIKPRTVRSCTYEVTIDSKGIR